jgi:dTDP-L-rhamnose 4-epimerase
VRDLGTTLSALDGIEAVYHFAAGTGVGQSMYDIASYVSTNSVGTATLLEAIVKRGKPLNRLVLSSSRAVYGEGTYHCVEHGVVYPPIRARHQLDTGDFYAHCPLCNAELECIPTEEDRSLAPISVYGWTKKHQEDLCRYVAGTFGIPLVMLRYFNVYGSRQSLNNPYTGVVTVFFNRILAGKPSFLYEQGLPIRDFVHVHDVARANVLALTSPIPTNNVVNVGSGDFLTIGQLAKTLASTMGRPTTLEPNNEFRVGDIFACVASMERARDELGYQPQVSLANGMREFFDWAQHQEASDRYDVTVQELSKHGLFGRANPSAA